MKNKIDLSNLIEEAKSNKQQAQTKLVNIFWTDIKRYIFITVKDANIAEELTIETFTKALQKLYLYNSDFDFKTWLVSIAHNTSIDYLRKRGKSIDIYVEEYVESEDLTPSPEQLFIDKQDYEALENMLSKLPEKYRIIIQLRYIEGKKLNDIVEEIQLSLANVKVILMRARKLLLEIQQKNKPQ